MLLWVFCIAGIIHGAGFAWLGKAMVYGRLWRLQGCAAAQHFCVRAATELLAVMLPYHPSPFFSFLSIETRITRYASFVEVVAMIYVNIVL